MKHFSLTFAILALSSVASAQTPAGPAGATLAPAAPAAPGAAPTPAPTAEPVNPPHAPAPDAAPTPGPEAPAPSPSAATGVAGPTGPTIELDVPPAAPPPRSTPAGEDAPSEDTALYGLRDQRLAGTGTTLGGYGELHYSLDSVTGPGETEAEVDLHRLVLFVAHSFDTRLRFYSEIEVEHAVASVETEGEVAVEQAYVDYLLYEQAVGLRAGVILVPMGIINQWHEPPIFHGVERPAVDTVIIPSSWHEAGVGLFGEPVEGFRYELYVVSGLDASGFSADSGLRGGRKDVSEARTDGLAVTGRIEVEPTLGVVAGLSAYLGEAGPNADFFDPAGGVAELEVPVYGVSLDARARREGFEARAELAWFAIGDTAELSRVTDESGEPLGLDVGSKMYGVYGELAYDVLHATVDTDQQLLPFVRVERYDTLADVEGRHVIRAEEAFGITDVVAGLSYRPISQVAFKADYLWRSPDGPVREQGRLDLGVGVMF